jgi:hypothetical protein
MPKKILITKLRNDVTQLNDAQIGAYKAFMKASFEPAGIDVSFEIEEQNEENWWQHMLQHVHDEFKASEANLVDQLLSGEFKAGDESQGKMLPFPGSDETEKP